MRGLGILLMIGGGLAALYAFNMDTSVHSYGTYVAGTLVGGGDVNNLGLMQKQLMIFQAGLAAFIVGAIFAAKDEDDIRAPEREAQALPQPMAPAAPVVEESEWEREERLEKERRSDRIGYFFVGAVVVALVLVVLLSRG